MSQLKIVIVGLGVQGKKRLGLLGDQAVASVDPFLSAANFSDIDLIGDRDFDAVFLCVPDAEKLGLAERLVKRGKHVLIEKPLLGSTEELRHLESLARRSGVVVYTAYNHRFEPHVVQMADLLAGQELGAIYSCRMIYGNGTARLVRDSNWRDSGLGVLSDIGSHLLDLCDMWFADRRQDLRIGALECFENRAPDYAAVSAASARPVLTLEMTLCMWRNHFACDILGEKGSAHIHGLCKWGAATLTRRRRILPSGVPTETQVTLLEPDPTWDVEHRYFERLIEQGTQTDLSKDIWIASTLHRLGRGPEDVMPNPSSVDNRSADRARA